MSNIGYIGLGAMGGALARRLQATYPLTVWDLNTKATAAFEALGAVVAPAAAELARRCDVVLLCLTRASDVHTLIFGPGGLAEGLAAGTLVIDQTSGVPGETREIAARLATQGATLIDAPVSGGPAGAAAGTIAIMVSGPDESLERASPVLEAVSPHVIYCGAAGSGHVAKLMHNA